MRFFTSAIVAAAAFTSAVVARAAPATTTAAAAATGAPVSGSANPITAPLGNVDLEAGKPFTITWQKNFGEKVTLKLRKGEDENNLDDVVTIVSDIPNSGTHTWTPSENLKEGEDYSIEIIADGSANYSPRFTINSEGEGISSSKSASASATSSASKSSGSASASATKSSSADPSAEPSSEPSSTDDDSDASSTGSGPEATSSDITAASNTDSGAGQLSSPLALVLCIVASLVYFH